MENFNKAFQSRSVQIEHTDDLFTNHAKLNHDVEKIEQSSVDGKEQPEIKKSKLAGTDKRHTKSDTERTERKVNCF